MKKVILSIGIVVCLGLISFGQDATKTAAAAPNPNAPEITFEETAHDFATLQKGDECSHGAKWANELR